MEFYTYEQITEKYGEEVAYKAISTPTEATGRLMYPSFEDPENLGKNEWAGEPIEADGDTITAYYYLSDEDEIFSDSFDWESNVRFQIEEGFK